MKTDYPELEGKVIDFVYYTGEVAKVKVVGCNYYVGITAVNIKDTELKEICLNKKIHSKGSGSMSYRQGFHYMVKQIQLGIYNVRDARVLRYGKFKPGRGNQNCAFGA